MEFYEKIRRKFDKLYTRELVNNDKRFKTLQNAY